MAGEWLSMAEAARLIGPRRDGRPTHPGTVRDWCVIGLRGVKLQHERRGGMLMTRTDWLTDWQAEYGRACDEARAELRRRLAEIRTPARRRRQQEAARRRNERAGAR